MKRRDPPTAEEVIAKLKDDGDFDALRLKVVRKVKENEDLRKTIVTEVKQSVILNTDGSEDLKPRQLSDAIYQELGSKIMGQISDEIWKVIKSNDSIKNDIRGTVETVYKRLVNPEEGNGDLIHSSPAKEQPISGTADKVPPLAVSTCEIGVPDGAEPMEPPGFVRCDQQTSNNTTVHKELVSDDPLCLQRKQELHWSPDAPHPKEAMPPGFDGGGSSTQVQACISDEDPDVPPGFG